MTMMQKRRMIDIWASQSLFCEVRNTAVWIQWDSADTHGCRVASPFCCGSKHSEEQHHQCHLASLCIYFAWRLTTASPDIVLCILGNCHNDCWVQSMLECIFAWLPVFHACVPTPMKESVAPTVTPANLYPQPSGSAGVVWNCSQCSCRPMCSGIIFFDKTPSVKQNAHRHLVLNFPFQHKNLIDFCVMYLSCSSERDQFHLPVILFFEQKTIRMVFPSVLFPFIELLPLSCPIFWSPFSRRMHNSLWWL